jgi:ketosteroid isomerase-like protein
MRIVSLLFLSLALSTWVAAQSDRQRSVIVRDITAVLNTQADAWNRGDIEEFMLGYWNSEKLVFASGDSVTHGWQTTLDRYKKNYNSREKMGTLKFSDLEINVISRDAAVVLGSWSLTRTSDNPKGKFTLVFRKFKEGWRIVHDHTS